MMVEELGQAATLAEELSRYRHKTVRLIVMPAGIEVDGRLIRPDGVEMQRFCASVGWAAVAADGLEPAIRDVDRRLVAEWTNMEPADDH